MPTEATGRPPASILAAAHAAVITSFSASMEPDPPTLDRPKWRARPRIAPLRSMRTASAFELPPSTARTGGVSPRPRSGGIDDLRSGDERGAVRGEAIHHQTDRLGGHAGPRVEDDDGAPRARAQLVQHRRRDARRRRTLPPVAGVDAPVHVAISKVPKLRQHAGALGALPEGAAEPGPGIGAGDVGDALGSPYDVHPDALVRQERHRPVVVRVVPDDVAVLDDAASEGGM